MPVSANTNASDNEHYKVYFSQVPYMEVIITSIGSPIILRDRT